MTRHGHGRLRRLEKALEVIDEEVPLATIRLSEVVYLAEGELEPFVLVAELRWRWLAGDRREWPQVPEFLAIRDSLLERTQ